MKIFTQQTSLFLVIFSQLQVALANSISYSYFCNVTNEFFNLAFYGITMQRADSANQALLANNNITRTTIDKMWGLLNSYCSSTPGYPGAPSWIDLSSENGSPLNDFLQNSINSALKCPPEAQDDKWVMLPLMGTVGLYMAAFIVFSCASAVCKKKKSSIMLDVSSKFNSLWNGFFNKPKPDTVLLSEVDILVAGEKPPQYGATNT